MLLVFVSSIVTSSLTSFAEEDTEQTTEQDSTDTGGEEATTSDDVVLDPVSEWSNTSNPNNINPICSKSYGLDFFISEF